MALFEGMSLEEFSEETQVKLNALDIALEGLEETEDYLQVRKEVEDINREMSIATEAIEKGENLIQRVSDGTLKVETNTDAIMVLESLNNTLETLGLIGYDTPSLESINSPILEVKIALEEKQGMFAKAWEKLKELWERLVNAIKKLFGFNEKKAKETEEKAKEAKEATEEFSKEAKYIAQHTDKEGKTKTSSGNTPEETMTNAESKGFKKDEPIKVYGPIEAYEIKKVMGEKATVGPESVKKTFNLPKKLREKIQRDFFMIYELTDRKHDDITLILQAMAYLGVSSERIAYLANSGLSNSNGIAKELSVKNILPNLKIANNHTHISKFSGTTLITYFIKEWNNGDTTDKIVRKTIQLRGQKKFVIKSKYESDVYQEVLRNLVDNEPFTRYVENIVKRTEKGIESLETMKKERKGDNALFSNATKMISAMVEMQVNISELNKYITALLTALTNPNNYK